MKWVDPTFVECRQGNIQKENSRFVENVRIVEEFGDRKSGVASSVSCNGITGGGEEGRPREYIHTHMNVHVGNRTVQQSPNI